ncbi:glutathione transferase [Ranunculus cassubicifolius]
MAESRAITRYIATKHKDKCEDLLRLDNLKEAAVVNVWMEVEAHQYGPPIAAIVYQRMVVPMFFGGAPDEKIIETNEKLSKTKYLAGEFFSLADLHHLPYTPSVRVCYSFYFMKTPEAKMIESRAHVKAWWEDISSRPAFQKVADGMKTA